MGISSKGMYTHKVGSIMENITGTVTKSNSQSVGRGKFDTPYTHIHHHVLSRVGTGISIKSDEVKLDLTFNALHTDVNKRKIQNINPVVYRKYNNFVSQTLTSSIKHVFYQKFVPKSYN